MRRPLDLDKCDVLLVRPRLRILGAPLDQVFVMKLFAGRDSDREDMLVMWHHTGFISPQQAADAFQAAYPHLEHDPYLAEYLAEVQAAAAKH
jgi:hypothetical protein